MACERRSDDIARTMTLENGKPLAQSRGEMAMTIDHLRWFAGEAGRTYGRVVPNQVPGKRHMVLRTPVGVVGAISPWNFPLVLAVRKIAPALAAGCTVVHKPASATPLCSVAFAEAVEEAKAPPGIYQLINGKAAEIGAEMLENPICRKISFTGSTEVGRQLIAGAAAQVKKLSLELGGHAPVVVFADADLDRAVEGTLIAKIRNTGQSCISANRAYVQRPIYDRFVAKLVERVKALKIGDGLEEGVEIGPLIDRRAVEFALEHIRDAVAAGGKIACAADRRGRPDRKAISWSRRSSSTFLPQARCMYEETFAPVLPLTVFDHEDEAVRMANASTYGLAAYVFTQNLSRAWRMAEAVESGTVAINDSVPSTSQCPFGGMKESGWGRELGIEGIDAFLETKHISLGIDERP